MRRLLEDGIEVHEGRISVRCPALRGSSSRSLRELRAQGWLGRRIDGAYEVLKPTPLPDIRAAGTELHVVRQHQPMTFQDGVPRRPRSSCRRRGRCIGGTPQRRLRGGSLHRRENERSWTGLGAVVQEHRGSARDLAGHGAPVDAEGVGAHGSRRPERTRHVDCARPGRGLDGRRRSCAADRRSVRAAGVPPSPWGAARSAANRCGGAVMGGGGVQNGTFCRKQR